MSKLTLENTEITLEDIKLKLETVLNDYKNKKIGLYDLEGEGEDLVNIIYLKYPRELISNNNNLLSVYDEISGLMDFCFGDPFMPEDVDATLEFLNTDEVNIVKAREKFYQYWKNIPEDRYDKFMEFMKEEDKLFNIRWEKRKYKLKEIKLKLEAVLNEYKNGKLTSYELEKKGEEFQKIMYEEGYPGYIFIGNKLIIIDHYSKAHLFSVFNEIIEIISCCLSENFMPEDVDATLEFLNTDEANIVKSREKFDKYWKNLPENRWDKFNKFVDEQIKKYNKK